MNGYVMVPGWLIDQHPSGQAVLAYVVLASYGKFDTAAGIYDKINPTIKTIARDMGISDATAKRALRELRDLGAIEVDQRFDPVEGDPTSNQYRVIFGEIVRPATPGGVTRDPRVESPVTYKPEERTYPEEVLNPPTTSPTTGNVVGPHGHPAPRECSPPFKDKIKNQDAPRAEDQRQRPRARRLPEDFNPTPAMYAWATQRAPGVDVITETEKFDNYWRAKAGQGATKLDWPATWRNWILSAATRSAPSVPRFGRSGSNDIDWSAAMARARAREAREAVAL